MKRIISGIFLTSFVLSTAWAGKTNIYEQAEVATQSFTAKVKSVRDAGDEGVDITFESDAAPGFYSLSPRKVKNYDQLHQVVEKSRKAGGPLVKVTAEKDDKIILSITVAEKDPAAPDPAKKVEQKDVDAALDKILKGN